MSWTSKHAAVARRLAAAMVLAVGLATSGAPDNTRAAGETRSLTFFNIHNSETTTIAFRKDGQAVPGALDKFNWTFRDWRKNEPTHMDPALLDLLWEIHTELGSRQPIHIISGYRSKGTNEMLRATVGGQASESRHILGKAADVHFPDVELRALRYSALIRERGGVGYYPTSAIPFVHVDTDRVRHWPRLPRHELALLFPSGQSKHQPADGRPITIEDVRAAQTQHRDLAQQMAAFFDSRAGKRPPMALAGLTVTTTSLPPVRTATLTPAVTGRGLQMASYQPPQLVEPPRIVDRPKRLAAPDSAAQARLTDLVARASFTPEPTPKLVREPAPALRPSQGLGTLAAADRPEIASPLANFVSSFALAPDFDEDHPEELSYRPFPIAPLLTATASADDPALAILSHPDVARTLDLLDQAGSMPPMRLRPSMKVAELMWSQQFRGGAVNLGELQSAAAVPGMSNRTVRTR